MKDPESEDEQLARELLLGIGPRGRKIYLKPGSEYELKARAALARVMLSEAPNGYFTRLVARLIQPLPPSALIQQKIIFKRPRGTPLVVNDQRRAEIAAFMQEKMKNQTRGSAVTVAQARNQKRAKEATMKKFGISRSTLMDIWSEFSPRKSGRRSPAK